MISKEEFKLFMIGLDRVLGKYCIWRFIRGGLWLNFTSGEWSRCKWMVYENHEGYIQNPFGGVFHRKFKEIIKIEEYWHGSRYYTDESKEKNDENYRNKYRAFRKRIKKRFIEKSNRIDS